MDLEIQWVEIDSAVRDSFESAKPAILPMEQGFEAEVAKLESDAGWFVLKVWNKGNNPDVQHQYRLLKALTEQGIRVSKPLGWGVNENGNKALLTTHDGLPPQRLDGKAAERIARLQSAIHRTRSEELGNYDVELPQFELVDYFFLDLKDHPDLLPIVTELVEEAPIRQDQLIHGDYHIMNLLERDGKFTIIDWTNCQLSDLRYDFAWSLALMMIYTSDRLAAKYREAYLAEIPIPPQELERFEALALLRWILFNRRGGVPRMPQTLKKVKALIASSPRLRDRAIAGFPSDR